MDAILELAARSRQCRELEAFCQLHETSPDLLDFLVEEIQLRLDRGFAWYSNRGLWEYGRFKLDLQRGPDAPYLMNDHAGILYARAIIILHPEFNGHCEFRTSDADGIFGTKVALEKQPSDYARRLVWADSTPIEDGWRPSSAHIVTHVAKRRPDIHERA